MTVDENKSWYIEENIERFTDLNPEEALKDEDFTYSNKMKGITHKSKNVCSFCLFNLLLSYFSFSSSFPSSFFLFLSIFFFFSFFSSCFSVVVEFWSCSSPFHRLTSFFFLFTSIFCSCCHFHCYLIERIIVKYTLVLKLNVYLQ